MASWLGVATSAGGAVGGVRFVVQAAARAAVVLLREVTAEQVEDLVHRHAVQVRLEAGGVGDFRRLRRGQQRCPDGLREIDRVELPPQPFRQLAADGAQQVVAETFAHLLGRPGTAGAGSGS